MGVSHGVERGVICMTAEGTFTTEDLVACAERARADDRVSAPAFLLLDVSESKMNATEKEVKRRVEILAEYARLLAPRIAIVVGDRELQYGLARMAAAHAESVGFEVRPFRTRGAALDWLVPATETNAPT